MTYEHYKKALELHTQQGINTDFHDFRKAKRNCASFIFDTLEITKHKISLETHYEWLKTARDIIKSTCDDERHYQPMKGLEAHEDRKYDYELLFKLNSQLSILIDNPELMCESNERINLKDKLKNEDDESRETYAKHVLDLALVKRELRPNFLSQGLIDLERPPKDFNLIYEYYRKAIEQHYQQEPNTNYQYYRNTKRNCASFIFNSSKIVKDIIPSEVFCLWLKTAKDIIKSVCDDERYYQPADGRDVIGDRYYDYVLLLEISLQLSKFFDITNSNDSLSSLLEARKIFTLAEKKININYIKLLSILSRIYVFYYTHNMHQEADEQLTDMQSILNDPQKSQSIVSGSKENANILNLFMHKLSECDNQSGKVQQITDILTRLSNSARR